MKLQTALGTIRGTCEDGVARFLGIPFARPPLGVLRWLAPQPSDPWQGELDATKYPNRCLQPPFPEALSDVVMHGDTSEDCLYLNIWAPPPDGRQRAVMFYIHGGGYAAGSANDLDPTPFVRAQDVIVVACNYRLGNFGFFDLSPCSERYADSVGVGFLDQILALRWVQENIADYGGDPGRVTLCGDSAGGGSIVALMAAPSAAGTFHRGIALSPGVPNKRRIDIVGPQSRYMGLDESRFLAALLAMSSQEIYDLPLQAGVGAMACVDGRIIVDEPARVIRRSRKPIDLVIGSCQSEGRLLTPMVDLQPGELDRTCRFMADRVGGAEYLRYVEASMADQTPQARMTRVWDDYFRSGVIQTAEASAQAGGSAWVYNFNVPTAHPLGATHASDLPFVFNLFPENRPLITFHDREDPRVLRIAEIWSNAMGEFVRSGNPVAEGLPQWPVYDCDARQSLVLEFTGRVVRDPDGDARTRYASV